MIDLPASFKRQHRKYKKQIEEIERKRSILWQSSCELSDHGLEGVGCDAFHYENQYPINLNHVSRAIALNVIAGFEGV